MIALSGPNPDFCMNNERVLEILRDAKALAREYYQLTGKPLGVTGEVAEYEAARLLGVELGPARQAGYDAVEQRNGATRHLQIKGRCLLPNCKPGQRLGSIDITKDWDAVLMVTSIDPPTKASLGHYKSRGHLYLDPGISPPPTFVPIQAKTH